MKVAILGASPKPDRYAHKAQQMLMELGHEVFPIGLNAEEILGRPVFRSIEEIPAGEQPIHTVTVYMNPTRFAEIADEVLKVAPARIIFNPGTESAEIAESFREAGVEVLEACTLVMLSTGQFEPDS